MSLIRYQTPELGNWRAVDQWSQLRDEINSLFEGPLWAGYARTPQLFNGWTPALDLYQDNDNVVAMVELPGLRKEDIEISLHDGTLTISGERKSEPREGEKPEKTERFVGRFRRSVTLPSRIDADKVNAGYKDGILTVTMPKAEEAKPKRIAVNVD